MLIDELRQALPQPGGSYLALKNLNSRDREALESIAKRGGAKGIGEARGLSHETVRAHNKKLHQKLHVKSKFEALALLAQESKI